MKWGYEGRQPSRHAPSLLARPIVIVRFRELERSWLSICDGYATYHSIYRFYHYSLNLYALYFEWSTWVVLVYYKNSSWSLGLWARYEPCLGVNISCPIKWNLNWCLYSWQFFLFFNELFSTISKKMSSLLHLEWLCGLFEYIWRWFFSFFLRLTMIFFMQYKICKWRIPSKATVVYTYSLSLYKYFHLLNTRISRAQPAENFLTISIQPKPESLPTDHPNSKPPPPTSKD